MTSKPTIANESGTATPKAMAPAAASTASISCVAYAVEDSASDANTARPTILRIAWSDASAVARGSPMSSDVHERRGFYALEVANVAGWFFGEILVSSGLGVMGSVTPDLSCGV